MLPDWESWIQPLPRALTVRRPATRRLFCACTQVTRHLSSLHPLLTYAHTTFFGYDRPRCEDHFLSYRKNQMLHGDHCRCLRCRPSNSGYKRCLRMRCDKTPCYEGLPSDFWTPTPKDVFVDIGGGRGSTEVVLLHQLLSRAQ